MCRRHWRGVQVRERAGGGRVGGRGAVFGEQGAWGRVEGRVQGGVAGGGGGRGEDVVGEG